MRGQGPECLSFITHLINFKNLDVLNCPSALIQKKKNKKQNLGDSSFNETNMSLVVYLKTKNAT